MMKIMENKKINKYKWLFSLLIIIAGFVMLTILLEGNVLNRQYRSCVIPICINIILAVSLNLVAGFLGELSLGHAGFMAVGAYSGALVTMKLDWAMPLEFGLALLVGGLVAAVFGVLVGTPVLRLRGDYLAIVTLAFGEIIRCIVNYLPITGAAMGLSGIERYSDYQNYILVYAIVVITILVIANLVKSRHGRAICAIRDNYIATQATGISVKHFKLLAFVVGAFFAGIAGVLYAHNVSIIKPDNFDYNFSIEILVIVVLGGMGSIRGSIIAAIVLGLLPEVLRDFKDFRMVLYAIAIIVIMIVVFNKSAIKKRLSDIKILNRFLNKKEAA